MAKGKERVSIIAHVDNPYWRVDDMPWKDIENSAGKVFSKRERQEIHGCVKEYYWELSLQNAGVSPKEIDALREDILHHARGLRKIWSYRKQFDFGRGNEPKDVSGRLTLESLGALHGDDGGPGRLYKELRRADMFSKRLIGLLERQTIATMNPVRTLLKTAALTKLIGAVLHGATESSARSKQPETKERERWGIPVGPRSTVFRCFVNAVLQSDFSNDQVRDAFRSALANISYRGE